MSHRPAAWRSPAWLRLHACFAAALALAVALDQRVFLAVVRWYAERPGQPVGGELNQLILSLAMFGQGLGMTLSVGFAALLDRKRRRWAALLLLLGAAALASTSAKLLVGRERPLVSRGETVLLGPAAGVKATRHQSFPSGHTTTAMAMAVGLSAFYPRARTLFFGLAAGVAANRVLVSAHYLSDVVAGAWLGYSVARWLVHQRNFWNLAGQLSDFRWSLAPARAVGQRLAALPRPGWGSPWLLFAASLALHWAGNAATPLWDRDEPRFATAAREMLARGDWTTPTFNGELRADKPILVYWQMMLSYLAFGATPFAARLWSGIYGAATVLLAYRLGVRLFDRNTGLAAGWILALSPMLLVEARLCTADATLLFWTTAAASCLQNVIAGGGRRPALLMWLCLALAGLAKGPVTLAFVGLAGLGYGLLRREWAWAARLHWGTGLAILVAVVGPWCWAVQRATGGAFLAASIGKHVVERATAPLEGHQGFPGYYLAALALTMAPWSFLIPWMLLRHRGSFRSDPKLAFLIAWAAAPLLLFEAIRTKLVHYILPTYPAWALLLAVALVPRAGSAGWRALPEWWGRFTVRGGAVAAAVALVAGLWAFPAELRALWGAPLLALAATFAAAGVLLAAGAGDRAFRWGVAGLAAVVLAMALGFAPRFGGSRAIHAVGRMMAARPDEPMALWLYRDPNLVFTLRRPLPVLDPLTSFPAFVDARRHAAKVGRYCVPIPAEDLPKLAADPALRVRVVDTVHVYDAGVFRWRDIHLAEVAPSETAHHYGPLRR